MKQIFGLIGDFYHPKSNAFDAIKKAVAANDAELIDGKLSNIILSDISAAIDKNPAAILLYHENRTTPEEENQNHWLTPKLDHKITDYVKNGGSLIALHTSIASYPKDSKYTDMVRGYFIDHPQEHYLVRYKTTSDTPIGNFDFQVMDEHYLLHVDEANTNVFMRHSSDFGEGASGWHHQYGSGKVIVLVPTHNKEGFENPEMARLLKSAIGWAI